MPIEVIRGGKRQTFTAVLGERPSEDKLATLNGGAPGLDPEDDETTQNAAKESLGLAVQDLTPEIARQLGLTNVPRGIVIGAVDPSSDAGGKGLRRGDIILSANQQPTLTAADLNRVAAEAKRAGRANVLLYIQRGNNPARYIAIKFK